MGTLLVKAGSLAITILRRSSYQSDVIQDQWRQTTEATRRIVSQDVARARDARSPEIRPAHVPKEPGTEFMLVHSVLVKANIVRDLIRSVSNRRCAATQYTTGRD